MISVGAARLASWSFAPGWVRRTTGAVSAAWIVAGITVLALGVRLAGLDARPVWADEAMSAYWASFPLSTIPGLLLQNESHPPLYYALLHFWLWLPQNDLVLRLPSPIFGALTVPSTFAIGRHLAGARVGVLAAAMLAIQPLAVWHSQEARPYALLTLLVALALWLVARPGGLRMPAAIVGYALVTALALYTHYGAALLLTVLAGATLVLRGQPSSRRALAGWLAGNVLAVALFTPWLLALGGVVQEAPGAYTDSYVPNPPNARALLSMPFDLLVPYAAALPGAIRLGVFGLLALVGALGTWRVHRTGGLLLVVWVGVSVGLVWWVAQRYPVFFQAKVFLPLMPALVILLAAGLHELWQARRRAGILAAVLMAAVFVPQTIQVYMPPPTYADGAPLGPYTEDWRSVASYVAERAAPSSVLLFLPAGFELPFARTYRGLPLPMHGLPVDTLATAGPLGVSVTPSDLPRLADQAGDGDFWLITLAPPAPQMGVELALAYYDGRAALRERVRFGVLLVNHYGPAPTAARPVGT